MYNTSTFKVTNVKSLYHWISSIHWTGGLNLKVPIGFRRTVNSDKISNLTYCRVQGSPVSIFCRTLLGLSSFLFVLLRKEFRTNIPSQSFHLRLRGRFGRLRFRRKIVLGTYLTFQTHLYKIEKVSYNTYYLSFRNHFRSQRYRCTKRVVLSCIR